MGSVVCVHDDERGGQGNDRVMLLVVTCVTISERGDGASFHAYVRGSWGIDA